MVHRTRDLVASPTPPRSIAQTAALDDARRRLKQDRSITLAIFGYIYIVTHLFTLTDGGLSTVAHWARHHRTTRVHHDTAPQSIAWHAPCYFRLVCESSGMQQKQYRRYIQKNKEPI